VNSEHNLLVVSEGESKLHVFSTKASFDVIIEFIALR